LGFRVRRPGSAAKAFAGRKPAAAGQPFAGCGFETRALWQLRCRSVLGGLAPPGLAVLL